MMRLSLLLVLACSSTQRSSEPPEPTPEPTPEPAPAEFVTIAELTSPDESVIVGVVVAMREAPRGDAADFVMPTGDHDPGDGHAVLFGSRLIRDGDRILSATTEERARRFELDRTALSDAVMVWTFEDATLSRTDRVEPCATCDPWQSPPGKFVLVVPEGQSLTATPEPGWTIAISP